MGLDVGAIGCSSLFGFCPSLTFAIWLFVVIFDFSFSIELWLPGEGFSISHHRQYLFVMRNLLPTFCNMITISGVFENEKLIERQIEHYAKNYQPYNPGQYLFYHLLHIELKQESLEMFIELCYATLCSWNMNQRAAKLAEFKDFKNSIIEGFPNIKELINVRLETASNDDFKKLRELFLTLEVVGRDKVGKDKPALVAASKCLHFFLPNFVMPIDRKYTLKFFHTGVANTIEKQADTFIKIQKEASAFSSKFNLEKYLDNEMNRNIPKLIDNLIISRVKLNFA